MNIGPGDLFFGWSWIAGVGVIILLGACLLPAIFFFLNLQNLLNHVSPANQGMTPGLVWLNFIPIFNLGWFIYTVIKVRDSVSAEFRSRGWLIDGDLGYNVGLAAGILWIASAFVGWIPFIGWVLPLGALICWIIYWLKTSDLKNRLEPEPAWRRPAGYQPVYPPAVSPYAPAYPQPYTAAAVAGAPAAPEDPAAPGAPVAAAMLVAEDGPGEERGAPAASSGEQGGADAAVTGGAAAETAASEKWCAACGSTVGSGDRFCRTCGLQLP